MCTLPALAVVGTGISVFGALSAGRTQEALAKAQAKAIEQGAEADRRSTNYEIANNERQFRSRQGQAIAQVGASGVGLEGSPTEVLAANAGEHQLDIEAIRYGSLLRAAQSKTQADLARFQGREARKASLFGAAGEAISGFGRAYSLRKSIRFGRSPFARPDDYNAWDNGY